MEIITYCLRTDAADSGQYYRDVAAFADEVLRQAERHTTDAVESFLSHAETTGIAPQHTAQDAALELLLLGVMWRIYGNQALQLPAAPRRALTSLGRLRQAGGCLKAGVDPCRAVLSTVFLSSSIRRAPKSAPHPPTVPEVGRLLEWMAASGDFAQEVKRLGAWRDFLAGQPAAVAGPRLAAAISFARWFEERSADTLGRYTPHVDRFLRETHPAYSWREDVIFCGRRRVEYHWSMVTTEILNRVYRDVFLETPQKTVLLPPCMKARQDGQCQALPSPFGERCAGCTPSCRIRYVSEIGRLHGFETLVMPDELSVFSSGAVKPVKNGSTGVVGVSCVLTNPPGGWETQELGVPAQGVLLDYCGCSWHWHAKGFPTDIDVEQLLRVLGRTGSVSA